VTTAEIDEMRKLYYSLWSKAEEGPGYDQKPWFRLQELINRALDTK
jgi:hypothetical protein